MAIKIKRPTFYKISAVKEFTDRVEPRKAFWNRYQKMVEEGSTIITFYGAGGVGKSALLEKLEKEIKNRDVLTNGECKYVKYDFEVSTDLREVLKTFKFQLSNYGCEFPLFDTGNYYYSLKVGQDVTPLKAKSMMEKISWLNKLKNNLFKADKVADHTAPMLSTAQKFFEMTDDVLQAVPVTRAITTCFTIADMLLVKLMESTQTLDEDHEEIRFQLNARFQEKSPVPLHNYLPTLFAQDVADWLAATGNKLVVLLDNYEKLVSATSLATAEQIRRDFWLRGDEGLIFMIPDTLWTIAGRNKLRWDGALADELDQHLIKALSTEDASQFLLKAGIKDETLRGELVKLTEGYPIFLDLCVDVYVEYKRQNNNQEPTIKEFGSKRQDVVARILRYIIEDKDDAARDMLEFLCMLNVWTDELAIDIGKKALEKFSRNTYKRVKNFSFIQEERIENEDFALTFYRFDKTIQSIIVKTLDKKFIDDVTTAVEKYFDKFFDDNSDSFFEPKNIFYLKLWAEILARFADDAETLWDKYDDYISIYVDSLIEENESLATAEEILNLFMSKVESLGDNDSEHYANFEMALANLRTAQVRYDEAYELAKSAYEKFLRFLGDDDVETIDAMANLALKLSDLGRYEEALPLEEKVLAFYEETGDDNNDDEELNDLTDELDDLGYYDEALITSAMNNLANTLGDLGRYDEALELQEKVLEIRREALGEEEESTVDAMINLAGTLKDLGRYNEALELQEKAVKLSGDSNYASAIGNLAIILGDVGRYDEALKLQEELLETYEEILGAEHPNTIRIMSNLAVTLKDLGRYDESLKLQEKVLSLYKKILGDKHPDTLSMMNNLSLMLSNVGRYEEALILQEEVLKLRKKILKDEHPKTIDAMTNLSITLNDLGRYDEALTLQEEILALYKKILGDEHPDTTYAMNNLATTLKALGRYDEALELQEEVLELRKKILGDEHPKTISAMQNVSIILSDLGRYDEALKLQEKVLKLSKKILGNKHPDTIAAMSNLASTLNDLGRYDESLELQEKALKLSKKILGDKHPDTIAAMHNLASTLNDMGCYGEAFELQEDVLELNRKILGDEHPDTILAMHNLAGTLNDLERYGEALTLQEKVLALYKNILGDEHPDTIAAMHNLANTLSNLERYKEAFTLQEKVLEVRKKILYDEHPDTILAMSNLAITLEGLERYEEALTLREKVLELNKKTLGEDDEDTINAMADLASTLEALDYYEEALPLREKALELYRKTLGEDDEDTINAMADLADTLYELERYEEAVLVQQEALELYKKVFGEDDEATLMTMNNLAMILHELNRDEEAQKIIKRARSTSKKVLSSDDELFMDIEDTYKKVFNS